MKTLSTLSPAKINLTLDVLPRQKNETFHQIRTIYHQISLTDEIEISESPFFSIEGFDFPIQENLIYQGFELIHAFFPKEKLPSVKVKINKNIPIGSGLGGGSSNFASFVKIYLKYFDLGEVPPELIENAGNYGKDIPFFLTGNKCALGENYGEIISPLDYNFSNTKIRLFQPNFKNATTTMYENLTNYGTYFTEKFMKNPNLNDCGNAFNEFFDLPQYQEITNDFSEYHLTGSGSCFFTQNQKNLNNCKCYDVTLA